MRLLSEPERGAELATGGAVARLNGQRKRHRAGFCGLLSVPAGRLTQALGLGKVGVPRGRCFQGEEHRAQLARHGLVLEDAQRHRPLYRAAGGHHPGAADAQMNHRLLDRGHCGIAEDGVRDAQRLVQAPRLAEEPDGGGCRLGPPRIAGRQQVQGLARGVGRGRRVGRRERGRCPVKQPQRFLVAGARTVGEVSGDPRGSGTRPAEHGRGVAVQGLADGAGQLAVNGVSDEIVPEAQRGRAMLDQQPGPGGLQDRAEEAPAPLAHDGGEIGNREVGSEDGGDLKEFLRARRQAADVGPDSSVEFPGKALALQPGLPVTEHDTARADQRAQQFGEIERVALGLVHQAGQRPVGAGAQHVCGNLGDRVWREGPDRNPPGAKIGQAPEQSVHGSGDRCRAAGEDPRDRHREQLCGQRRHGLHGCLIGPLKVVDRDQDRPCGGGRFERGVQPVQQPQPLIGQPGKVQPVAAEDRGFTGAQRGDQRAQRGDPVEFVGPRRRDGEPPPGGEPCRVLDQPGLADPRWPVNQHYAGRPVSGAGDRVGQDCLLWHAAAKPQICHEPDRFTIMRP